MDDFVSGAIFAHLANSSAPASNQITPQQYAQVYAAYTNGITEYNHLVKQYNALLTQAKENDSHLRSVIASMQKTIDQQQISLKKMGERIETLKTLLFKEGETSVLKDRIIEMMVVESENTPGHDSRPLSARKEAREQMMISLKGRLNNSKKPTTR